MISLHLEQVAISHLPLRTNDADCQSWHQRSHASGCADEQGQCGHAMNCPMFKRWIGESDPL
ncbi:MAG: hypothetical protein HQL44_17635 [Alphaproteobacteria bacterium]|nr:hypothetical protein [Alphaproteobacteria bacterium]